MTRERLQEMHYSSVKALAADIGVDWTNKAETIERILSSSTPDEEMDKKADAIENVENGPVKAIFLKNHILGRRGQVKEISYEDFGRLSTLKIVR